MGLETPETPITLVLAVLVVKELIALLRWSFSRMNGSSEAGGHVHADELAREVKRQLSDLYKAVARIEESHESSGHHHRAVELANRRVAAIMRKLGVEDPG